MDLEHDFIFGDQKFDDNEFIINILKNINLLNISSNRIKAFGISGSNFLKFYLLKDKDDISRFMSDCAISNKIMKLNNCKKINNCMPVFIPIKACMIIRNIKREYIDERFYREDFFCNNVSVSIGLKITQYHLFSISLWEYLSLRRQKEEGLKRDILFIIACLIVSFSNLHVLEPNINLHDMHCKNINVHFRGLKMGAKKYEPKIKIKEMEYLDEEKSEVKNHLTILYKKEVDQKTKKNGIKDEKNKKRIIDDKNEEITDYPLSDEIHKELVILPENPTGLTVSVSDFDLATMRGLPSTHINYWYYAMCGITTKPCKNVAIHTILNSIFMFYQDPLIENELLGEEREIRDFLSFILKKHKGIGLMLNTQVEIRPQRFFEIAPGMVNGVLSNIYYMVNDVFSQQGTTGYLIAYTTMESLQTEKSESKRKELYELLKYVFPKHHEDIEKIWTVSEYSNDYQSVFDVFSFDGEDDYNLDALSVLRNYIFQLFFENKCDNSQTLWNWDETSQYYTYIEEFMKFSKKRKTH